MRSREIEACRETWAGKPAILEPTPANEDSFTLNRRDSENVMAKTLSRRRCRRHTFAGICVGMCRVVTGLRAGVREKHPGEATG